MNDRKGVKGSVLMIKGQIGKIIRAFFLFSPYFFTCPSHLKIIVCGRVYE